MLAGLVPIVKLVVGVWLFNQFCKEMIKLLQLNNNNMSLLILVKCVTKVSMSKHGKIVTILYQLFS